MAEETKPVDYLQRAKAYAAGSDYVREDTDVVSAMALLSIAYSLVALTERLDKLIEDGSVPVTVLR